MSFNGSGTFQLNSGGLPYVTGTTISSTTANNLNTDLASGLSNVICKDGQTTVTANLPMATFRHTNVGAASARTDYARASQAQDSTLILIGSVAGTNTITGSLTPAITAYAAGQFYTFIPANTNTGATTININSVGARNVFWNGAACVGGELRQNVPAAIYDDGTRFHIVGNSFNAPFLDTHAVVEGSADSTKKVRFEVDGLTTATTRVITVPDRDFTLDQGLYLIQSQAASNSATIDFTTGISSTFDEYLITISGLVPQTDNTSLHLRVSENGTVWEADANDYEYEIEAVSAGAANFSTSSGAAQILLVGACGNSTGESVSGEVKSFVPSSATLYKVFRASMGQYSAAPAVVNTDMTGLYNGSQNAIVGYRFLMSSGNIASGTFSLYGVRKA